MARRLLVREGQARRPIRLLREAEQPAQFQPEPQPSAAAVGLVTLGFDTATADTVVGVTRDGEALFESIEGPADGGRPRHATILLPEIERAVEAAGGWDAVDRLAVGLGPGSFTGLRIGIATTKGLASARGLPAIGVCTLDALGRGIGERWPGEDCLAVLDARRREVFAALYSAEDGQRRWEPFVAPPEQLLERLAELSTAPRIAGSGALRFRDELVGHGIDVPGDDDQVHRVAARHVCALADQAANGDAELLAPIYLRPPDADRWRERDTAKRED